MGPFCSCLCLCPSYPLQCGLFSTFSCGECSASVLIIFWVIYTDGGYNLVVSVGQGELRILLLSFLSKNCFCSYLVVHPVSVSPSAVRPSDVLLVIINVCLSPLREHSFMTTIRRIPRDWSMSLSRDPQVPNQLVSMCFSQEVCHFPVFGFL